MKYTSWKVTFCASVVSIAAVALFLIGGHAATFAKTVYISMFAVTVLLLAIVHDGTARKVKLWQAIVGISITGAEIGALIFIGSPFLGSFALASTIYTKCVYAYKVDKHENELAQEG